MGKPKKKSSPSSADYLGGLGQLALVDIARITVGDRFRKNPLRNIEGLVQSIEEVGLLQFPLVDPDLNLIAGERRLEALKQRGSAMVQVIIKDIKDPVLAQIAENEYREAWTPEERMDCIMQMAKAERHSGRGKGNWMDRVAKAVGLSPNTVYKAYRIMKAAEDDPDRYGALDRQLRRSGRVDPVFQKFQAQRSGKRGIPTQYKGVTFRSQTEARWAALFDMKGSGVDAWRYEPYELSGWIPDFELKIGTEKILTEIKADTSLELLFCDLGKINRSGAKLPVWKLGGGIFSEWPDGSGRVAGICRDFSTRTRTTCWEPFVRPHEWSELWKKACYATQWRGNGKRS